MQEHGIDLEQFSRNLIQALVRSGTQGFLIADRSGRLVRANEAAARLLGQAQGGLLGRSALEFLGDAFRPGMLGSVTEIRVNAAPVEWIEVSALPVADGWAILLRDVTRNHRADEELQTAHAQLRSLLAITEASLSRMVAIEGVYHDLLGLVRKEFHTDTAAILLLTQDQRHLMFCSAHGLEDDDAERSLKIPADRGVSGRILEAGQAIAFADGVDGPGLDLGSSALGGERVHAAVGAPLRAEGRVFGVLHVGSLGPRRFTEDETRMIQLVADRIALGIDYARLFERAQSDLAMLQLERDLREQFVSTLSHDLRGPLTAARMNAQMVLRSPRDPESHLKLAGRIVDNIDRADHMIRDLLDANRVRAGQGLPIERRSGDLRQILLETVDDLVTIHGDRFVVEAPEPVPGRWGLTEVRRAIENLAQNAIKYGSPVEPVRIELEQDADFAYVIVDNKGEPIPMAEQAHLFDPFRRATAAEKSGKRGWGLGLTLVRGVAEAHGGTVRVRSTLQEGTRFTLVLRKAAGALVAKAG